MITIGEYLCQRLHNLGVNHVFGVPGDYVLDLMDVLVESPIELVCTCNELNAGYAADAYARVKGMG
ncbi:MAG: thiamine pyrophosphate-binding protein, partial [Microcystis sp. M53601_WE4]|nr:thiamine pyrophosphate-binding protein [Microcystis sp. M53601_WE4]